MKKNLFRFLSLSLLISIFAISSTVVKASENEFIHENNSLGTVSDYYINENNQIFESATVNVNDENIILERIINTDGSYIATINNGTEIHTVNGYVDYDMFYQIASSYVYYSSIPSMLACNMNSSNFKHVYVGESSPKTIYKSQISNATDVSGLAAIFLPKLPGLPLNAIAGVAAIIFNRIENNTIGYKFTIYSTTYEIWFSYDNVYYTHCYHQTVKYFDEKNVLLRTDYDYIQSVGG